MGHGPSPARQFADAFRRELDRQKLGVRTLARQRDPGNLERERRNLHRWLSGQHLPVLAVRRELAVELGVDPGTFEVDADDDSEAAELLAVLDPLVRLLDRRWEQLRSEREGAPT